MYIGKNDGVCPISQAEIDRDLNESRDPQVHSDPDAAYDAEQLRLTVQDQEAISKILVENIHATKDLLDALVEYVRKARRGLV
jgi:hypothetical protein|tara:strand:- start:1295 stop:1543 length:249 start_codon:yes stop_codon:yes gene_type:complete